MRILGIETSCDETAIAVIDASGQRARLRVRALSNVVASQVKLHAKYGGVVPHLAKREHQKNLVPVLLTALLEAKLIPHPEEAKRPKDLRDPSLSLRMTRVEEILEREPDLFARMIPMMLQLKPLKIDAIAVTVGPGLAPALWVGVNFARALSYVWQRPIIAVNHMAGHFYSALLQPAQRNPKSARPRPSSGEAGETRNPKQIKNSNTQNPRRFWFGISNLGFAPNLEFRVSDLRFPALALLVSGGHTELVLMKAHGKFQILGETLDDAAGEAFDKVAKMLGLGFPGGPPISRLAERGNPQAINFPRPMLHSKDFNFSFSGLKTAVLYYLRDRVGSTTRSQQQGRVRQADVAASFEQAVPDVLVAKTVRAAKQYRVKTVMIGGGVAANKKLRAELGEALARQRSYIRYLIPDVRLTGDNALMIALAGWFNRGKKQLWRNLVADANLRLDTKTPH
mgnify:FL=1